MSSSSLNPSGNSHAEASSSYTPSRNAAVENGDSDEEEDLLASDPLTSNLSERISFKRKAKAPTFGFSIPRFLSSPAPGNSHPHSPSPRRHQTRARHLQTSTAPESTAAILSYLDTPADGGTNLEDTKDGNNLDWYVEGPGRRVGYDDLTAIDWIFEYAKERQRLRLLYSSASGLVGHVRQLADASQIWWILVATGISAGLVAAFIDVASDWLGDLKTGHCRNVGGDGRFYLNKVFCCWGYDSLDKCHDWTPWSSALGVNSKAGSWIVEYIFFVVLSIMFAACASVLVQTYAIYAKHSGIPEIKTVLGGYVIRRFLGAWTLVIKSLGLCLAVASGLWLGKEGPLVHVACCCANLFLKLSGSINSNEAILLFPDKTMWQSFVCAMVAAVTLQAFNPFRTGKLVLYQVTYHSGWHHFEMVPFALLGILGGLYGSLFIKLNMRIAEWRRSHPIFKGPVLEVVFVTLITALINFPIKFMRAQASELVYVLFAECADIQDDQLGLCKSGKANTGVIVLLLISALLGFFLAALTFGLQIPAGIILPSMAIGALYGRAVGLVLDVWQAAHPGWIVFAACEPDKPCITPGTYAIVGAASALGGATRLTVSIVVIMFELTGALTYVLPIMIAVMISKWVGDAISPRGIYESWIHFNGYPFMDNRDDNSASVPDVPASNVFTRIEDLVVITGIGHTIQSLRTLLARHPFRGFPVIDNPRDAILLGYISRTELDYALGVALSAPRNLSPDTEAHFAHQPLSDPASSLDLRPWMDQTPITLNARAGLGLTVNMFMKLGLRYVLFVDKGALRGLLTKKDVWLVLSGQEESNARGQLREDGGGVEERGLLDDETGDHDEEERRGLG
ncbi:chloride channel [Coniosporium tulheliwenetii]|uniref:Chloride channel n=1 Tax=Coniosporium tulheliwenetii TaxID=3383036 RepID=A0ACC2YVZ4_9PEZI|nr:chloride channel [Cladosporium sp. JES 115]